MVTIALEQARKRSLRRILEIAFLNHHVHNAMAQMVMASNLTESDKQDRYIQEAVSRISEALFRVANNADAIGLSLDVDLDGTELTRDREDREKQWVAKTA
jgi:light-regulated signal transduction histidine kinase (bacteriophytochrome)